MKAIGLTQRVMIDATTGERRDCLDQAWAELADELGFVPVPLANRAVDGKQYITSLGLTGIILTGGNDIHSLPDAQSTALERDNFEMTLIDYCLVENIPILGVCRGMQMLNMVLGGRVQRLDGHIAKRHTVVESEFRAGGGRMRNVNSFHGFGIADRALAPVLKPTWRDEDGWVEGARHSQAKAEVIMWHPEREEAGQRGDDLEDMARLFGL